MRESARPTAFAFAASSAEMDVAVCAVRMTVRFRTSRRLSNAQSSAKGEA